MEKLHLISLGCNKNLVDSEVMLGKLSFMKMTNSVGDADVIIINTCGFIDAAKEESISTILDTNQKRKKDSVLVVAGCLTQRYKEELQKDLPEVDLFTGVGDYANILELLKEKKSTFSNDVFLIDNEERVVTGSSYHAYIKISEGCNQLCSFCAIPSFKGKLHSRSLDSIVKEVKRLVSNGYFDFSFISQDSSSFMRDLKIKDGLILLIKEIEKIEGIKKARIMYLYPTTISFELIDAIKNSKVFENYFDIPVQHISDNMLKIMKRGMDNRKTLDLVNEMKKIPNSWIRTSFIIGHPGETEDDFNQVVDVVNSGLFDMINIFSYSKEEGTIAFDMKDEISEKIKNKRIAKLEELILDNLQNKLLQFINKKILVVVNGESDEHEYLISAKNLSWCLEIDPEIIINESEVGPLKHSDITQVLITEVIGDKLLGKAVK